MSDRYYNQTIALAGLMQCLKLVQDIAWRGHCDPHEYKICVSSLFQLNPADYQSVYAGTQNLVTGANTLKQQLSSGRDKETNERTRYLAGLFILQKRLTPQSDLFQQFDATLSLLEEAARDFDNQRDYITDRLAQLYQNTLSKQSPRIIIYGEPRFLQENGNAASIRALLLASIRALVLWSQAGGTQWSLIFSKRKYLNHIKAIRD